jgi:DUF1365 family protein
MTDVLAIWRGETGHVRHTPFRHGFRYPLAMVAIALDRLEEAGRASPWFSVNRFNLFSFHERDFGARDGSSPYDWAVQQFAQSGIGNVERVTLYCQPRILGYQFNPISLHFGYAADGRPVGIIYEVHNTFGDAHAYIAPIGDTAVSRHEAKKRFHVSPFFDLSGTYAFSLTPPDETFQLGIRKIAEGQTDFYASMAMKKKTASSAQFLKWFAGFPASTLFTIAMIHVEAFKLWIKGARFHKRPAPPENSTPAVLESRSQNN